MIDMRFGYVDLAILEMIDMKFGIIVMNYWILDRFYE